MSHTIAVVGTQKGLLVRPAFELARNGEELRFLNLTPMPCQLLVPMFSFCGDAGLSAAIPPGRELTVTIDSGGRRGSFPYQVYLFSDPDATASLEQHRLFAIGESAPHVIIE